ncbi:IS1182 family transposase [Companilactobacillus muriivasis]|uniref:IS1182 family transposase n=1 Tax=Companilactobacillus muriivasis TaxID=3081444 RepID=UPI0030C6D64A
MLKHQEELKLSPYSSLYDAIIPKDNELRLLLEMMDFNFIYDELASKYCLDDGRNAVDPIQMFKYLYLKVLYNMSDRDLVKRAKTDMAMKFFLGLNPEDDVIHPSLLTKFRRQRLKDSNLLDMLIAKTVDIAMDNGLIKTNRIIIDSTHTAANFNQKTPIETLRAKSKKLRKEVYRVNEGIKPELPDKNTTNDLEQEKNYTGKLIKKIKKHKELPNVGSVNEALNNLEEFLDDIKDCEEYSKDSDAKVGHKTRDTEFFGYKTHIAMTDERIITAAIVTSGEKGDGPFLKDLVDQTRENKVEVCEVIGDRAYSGKENMDAAEEKGFVLVSGLHPVMSNGTRKKDELWDFNKDAGMFICPAGNMAYRKSITTSKKHPNYNPSVRFYFDVEKCKECPLREHCYKPGAKSKSYSVSIKSDAHKYQQDFEKTEYFQNHIKTRYKIEAKNSEMKIKHGYRTSTSSGIEAMKLQGALTIFCANVKRIQQLEKEEKEKNE